MKTHFRLKLSPLWENVEYLQPQFKVTNVTNIPVHFY